MRPFAQFSRLFSTGFGAIIFILSAQSAGAQDQADNRNKAAGKLYIAEAAQITRDGETRVARQGETVSGEGTTITTNAKDRTIVVFSNYTVMVIEPGSLVKIRKFVQEIFQGVRIRDLEPSISHSDVFLAYGGIELCVSSLLTGSTMIYATPHAQVDIRRGRVAIRVVNNSTIVDLLDGDASVRCGDWDANGQVLRSGERAVIKSADRQILITTVAANEIAELAGRSLLACQIRQTVAFASDEAAGGDNAIAAKPVVPVALPTNITISPDRLP